MLHTHDADIKTGSLVEMRQTVLKVLSCNENGSICFILNIITIQFDTVCIEGGDYVDSRL